MYVCMQSSLKIIVSQEECKGIMRTIQGKCRLSNVHEQIQLFLHIHRFNQKLHWAQEKLFCILD